MTKADKILQDIALHRSRLEISIRDLEDHFQGFVDFGKVHVSDTLDGVMMSVECDEYRYDDRDDTCLLSCNSFIALVNEYEGGLSQADYQAYLKKFGVY